MREWEDKAIRRLKAVGQTIIDNAEKMIGGYKSQEGKMQWTKSEKKCKIARYPKIQRRNYK